MKKIIFLTFFCILSQISLAQRIENLNAKVVNKMVEISYDLTATADDQTFDILLFSSVNKFTQPLERVSGDLGKNVKPGKNKVIQWNPESELVQFKGEVIFELQVKVFTPFVSINTPGNNEIVKRGKTRMIEWTGGNANTKLNLDLYHDEIKLATIETADNTGKFKWSVPASVKPGSNYKILIYESGKSDNRAFSKPFVIRRKIPVAIKVSASILGAGLISYVISNLSGGNTKEPAKIPFPPTQN